METMNPSPFYDQLFGAEKFRLIFPLERDCVGPDWLESGELVRKNGWEPEIEVIEAVSLGGNRYRLAERCSHFQRGGSAQRVENRTHPSGAVRPSIV